MNNFGRIYFEVGSKLVDISDLDRENVLSHFSAVLGYNMVSKPVEYRCEVCGKLPSMILLTSEGRYCMRCKPVF